jgi:C1A family cysteine protease
MPEISPHGFGWQRGVPDPRDFTPRHDAVTGVLRELEPLRDRPEHVDWREYCPAVKDQGTLPLSPASCCADLLAYFERRSSGRVIEPSRLFILQAAQRLVGSRGETGVPLRAVLEAIARIGVPDEHLWPFEPERLLQAPDAFVYAAARTFPGLRYVRLDPPGARGRETLKTVKSFLAAGFACVFGFPVPTTLTSESEIPYPTVFDAIRGGQAAVAVGFDNHRRIRSDRGGLLIACPWGPCWGERGFGWMPYCYVTERLAVDFWTMVRPAWLASGEFNRPT